MTLTVPHQPLTYTVGEAYLGMQMCADEVDRGGPGYVWTVDGRRPRQRLTQQLGSAPQDGAYIHTIPCSVPTTH